MNEIRNLLVGLEIGREYSQIACYNRRMRDAECISTKAGTELLTFPTVMCRMHGAEEWHFGREAEYFAGRGQAAEVRDLYDVFCTQQKVSVDGQLYEPKTLLAIFIRETLGLLGVNDVLANLKGLVVTTDRLDRLFAKNVKSAAAELTGSIQALTVQDRMESFYYYCLSTNTDALKRPMCLLEMNGSTARSHRLTVDASVNPMTARVEAQGMITLAGDDDQQDTQLLRYMTENLTGGETGGVYITGDGFDQEKYSKTTAFLCRDGRRVFAGNNLFVKGACFAAYEKTEIGRTKNILYLGKEVVPCNIGTTLTADGEEVYVPIITAGTNWFENRRTFDCILEETEGMSFEIRRMNESGREAVYLPFEGLPQRPAGATRMRIAAECISEEECEITAQDLGFGGFYPSSGKKWHCRIFLKKENEGAAGGRTKGKLCKIPMAAVPFPIESVGTDAMSIEEICYFMYRYPELLDADIVSPALSDWFEEELGLAQLAMHTKSALRGGEDLLGFILPIFRTAGYLTEAELKEYRARLAELMKDPPLVRMKKKGDALAGYGKYISALNAYRKSLREADEKEADPVFLASLYHNMGSVYMQMLLYEESLDSFKKAYIRYHTRESLKTYLMAASIARPRSKYEEILRTMHVDEALQSEIDSQLMDALHYRVPESEKDPNSVVAELIAEYRNAAGMPLL